MCLDKKIIGVISMLCWNVYVGDFNTGEMKVFNVFNHYGFYMDLPRKCGEAFSIFIGASANGKLFFSTGPAANCMRCGKS